MIAQQDYLHFKQSLELNDINFDCELIAFLLTCWDRKTIWDAIIETGAEGDEVFSRVTQFSFLDSAIKFGSLEVEFVPGYTARNYEGLAAIEKALLAAGESVESVPELVDSGSFYISADGHDLGNSEGFAYGFKLDSENHLSSIYVIDKPLPEGGLVISEEDAQKLIGLPVA